MSTKQILGLAGSALLFFGNFTPAVSGFLGSQTFFQGSPFFGPVILLLAGLSAFLTLKRKYAPLVLVGVAALVIVGLLFVATSFQMSGVFGGVRLGSAWMVLGLGAGLLIAAGVLKENAAAVR